MIGELAEFVEANEPGPVAYNVYFSDHGSEMTVMHVHDDAASLDYHMGKDVGKRQGRRPGPARAIQSLRSRVMGPAWITT